MRRGDQLHRALAATGVVVLGSEHEHEQRANEHVPDYVHVSSAGQGARVRETCTGSLLLVFLFVFVLDLPSKLSATT